MRVPPPPPAGGLLRPPEGEAVLGVPLPPLVYPLPGTARARELSLS